MEFNPQMSLFRSAGSEVPYKGSVTPEFILNKIKTGAYKQEVQAVRDEANEDEQARLKKRLKAVTWSGTFSPIRQAENVTSYSQLICHDIDEQSPADLQAIYNQLATDRHVFAAFISPSAKGLKVLFRTEISIDTFPNAWMALGAYLEAKFKDYGMKVDQKCKDISRLCFVSYDPDLHYYPASKIIDHGFIEKWLPEPEPAPAVKHGVPIGDGVYMHSDYIQKCYEIVTRTVHPVKGSYNDFINQFSIQANRYGVEDHHVADAIAHYCGWAKADKEDWAVINSVYKKFRSEHGKYLDSDRKYFRPTADLHEEKRPEKPKEKGRPAGSEVSEYDTSVMFWYQVPKYDKEGKKVVDQATGDEIGEYKYSYDDAITFLENNGFYKFRTGTGYQFIRVDAHNKQVEIVDELRIKEFMIDFLKSQDTNEYKRVREMFRRGAKNYCGTGILEGLSYYTPALTRDTATHAFIYFQNCFLDITQEGAVKRKYNEQPGFIWKKQMLPFDFQEADFQGCDANLFVWYAVTGRKAPIAERTPEEIQKYESLCTTIGYTLHRYKSPALTKAPVTTDKKLRSTGENNGRSGKSLIIKLISKMINVVTIDGRNFSFDKDFNFQKVNLDTSLINFDDVKPNFDFSRLFSMITEEFSFEKKRIDLITIPYADAPKFWISSNSSIKGGGESSIARQQIIEFSGYFNSSHSPANEFGRMFFDGWDNEEWQRYYNFMIYCVRLYLEKGLIDFPLENYGLNKLIDTAGEEFVDYMEDNVQGELQHRKEFDSQALYDAFISKFSGKYPPKKNTFSKWIKSWADLHGLLINAHKLDGRDRRNGTDFLIFTPAEKPAAAEDGDKLPF